VVLGTTEVLVDKKMIPINNFQHVSPSFRFHFAAQMGVGLPAMLVGTNTGKLSDDKIRAVQGLNQYEMATLYSDIAGLLNYLVAMHLLLMTEVMRRMVVKEKKDTDKMVELVLNPPPEERLRPMPKPTASPTPRNPPSL